MQRIEYSYVNIRMIGVEDFLPLLLRERMQACLQQSICDVQPLLTAPDSVDEIIMNTLVSRFDKLMNHWEQNHPLFPSISATPQNFTRSLSSADQLQEMRQRQI